MKIPSIFVVAYAAVAIATAVPAAAHGPGETVTPHFQQAISNIPGKSLVALVVDYAPGGTRLRTSTPSRRSSSPTSCRAKLNRR